jgi:WD40 repeat protein
MSTLHAHASGDLKERSNRTVDAHRGEVCALALVAGAPATSGQDGTIKLWDVESAAPRVQLQADTCLVSSLSYSNGMLLSTSSTSAIKIWDTRASKFALSTQFRG